MRFDEGPVTAYMEIWNRWDPDHFERSYFGSYHSEEEWAEEALELEILCQIDNLELRERIRYLLDVEQWISDEKAAGTTIIEVEGELHVFTD